MTEVRYVSRQHRRVEAETVRYRDLAPGDRVVLDGLLPEAGTVLAVRRHRSPRHQGWRYRLEVRLDGPSGWLVNPEGGATRRALRIVQEAAEAASSPEREDHR